MDRHPADILTPADAERARLAAEGLYRPDLESDACGVGLVAAIDGKPSRRVVEAGIEALKAVWHRGAVDADGKTGDGAGIHIDLPVPFFLDAIDRAGQALRLFRHGDGTLALFNGTAEGDGRAIDPRKFACAGVGGRPRNRS